MMYAGIRRQIYRKAVPVASRLCTRPRLIPVIYYHDIVPDGSGYSFARLQVSRFRAQMRYLRDNDYVTYTFTDLPERLRKADDSREVLITFDDGFRSNYTLVLDIMRDLGLKLNVFLTVGYMEARLSQYLSWDMVEKMQETGLVGFGAHTYTHIDARRIDEECYPHEIQQVNTLIRRHTGQTATDFCFPFGTYDRRILRRLCEDSCYSRIFTSDYRRLTVNRSCEVVGRAGISDDDSMATFAHKVAGRYNIMYYLNAVRRMVR